MIDRTIVQGATGIPLTFTLQEKDGSFVDLTAATAVRYNVEPTDRSAGCSSTDAIILDARRGLVRHFFTANEVARPTFLAVQVSWVDASGRPRALPDNRYFVVQVIRRLGR